MTKREIMTKAVELAKKMKGDWIARMSIALKAVWAMVKSAKKTMEQVAEYIKQEFDKAGLTAQVNIWEKYGKRRIYVNKSFKSQIGMIEFDQDDNIISEIKELDGISQFGAFQNGVEDEVLLLNKIELELVA